MSDCNHPFGTIPVYTITNDQTPHIWSCDTSKHMGGYIDLSSETPIVVSLEQFQKMYDQK